MINALLYAYFLLIIPFYFLIAGWVCADFQSGYGEGDFSQTFEERECKLYFYFALCWSTCAVIWPIMVPLVFFITGGSKEGWRLSPKVPTFK